MTHGPQKAKEIHLLRRLKALICAPVGPSQPPHFLKTALFFRRSQFPRVTFTAEVISVGTPDDDDDDDDVQWDCQMEVCLFSVWRGE